MIVIIGGAFQGKLEFARQLEPVRAQEIRAQEIRAQEMKTQEMKTQKAVIIADGRKDSYEQAFCCGIVNHLESYVKRLCEDGQDAAGFMTRLWEKNPDVIVVTCEVGCGIVPLEAGDRIWREAAGRASVQAAKLADEVYKMSCGIATRIK